MQEISASAILVLTDTIAPFNMSLVIQVIISSVTTAMKKAIVMMKARLKAMVEFTLGDSHLVENIKAVQELRKTGCYSEEQLQELYDKQVAKDKERESNE